MKYKILYLTLFPHIGGAETGLLYLLEALDKNRFDPFVVVPHKGFFSARLSETHAKILFLNLPGYFIRTLFIPGASPKGLYLFYRLCKNLKPDLIHLNHTTLALYAGFVHKLLNIPIVATSWVNADSIYFYQDIISHICIDRILAITPLLKNRMLRSGIVSKDKVDVLTPGINSDHFVPPKNKNKAKERLGIKSDDIVITIASRFDPTKDHLTFFRAIKLIIKKFPKIKIVIAADPQINLEDKTPINPVKKKIEEFLARNPQIKNKTLFIGYKQNMLPIYQASDILVSSSLYEGLGLILMEASSCGVPVVSTNFDAQHYVVKDGKSGFLVPIQDPKSLSEKLSILIKNPRLRKQFGKHARDHIIKHFSVKKYAMELEDIYISLIKPFDTI